ncbi:hypothetical protein VNO78_00566 [Psophocarpus tetragonolobus]|uniref:Uncharacterized protein n=1 Tax=Psophocarpus tetragonolobus TaxID=3891 RepID=A0AAN9XU65_PSOTE
MTFISSCMICFSFSTMPVTPLEITSLSTTGITPIKEIMVLKHSCSCWLGSWKFRNLDQNWGAVMSEYHDFGGLIISEPLTGERTDWSEQNDICWQWRYAHLRLESTMFGSRCVRRISGSSFQQSDRLIVAIMGDKVEFHESSSFQDELSPKPY